MSHVRISVSDIARSSILTVMVAATAAAASAPQPGQQTFRTATEACHALVAALQANSPTMLLNVLGRDAHDLIDTGDPAQDRADRADFLQKYRQMHRLVNEPDGTTTLYIGAENWPAPIPLVHQGDAWYFDSETGGDEVAFRQVGRNELAVIQTCHELAEAQKAYYGEPHDGDAGHHYARKFSSDPDKHDGLYWPTSGADDSLIGPLLAGAAMENAGNGAPSQPFEGYYFRLLAPANGEGFVIIAFPAEYRSSGVMTFLVSQDDVVYEKDLGEHTSDAARTLTADCRDGSWRKSQ